jgi:hypothetical protein
MYKMLMMINGIIVPISSTGIWKQLIGAQNGAYDTKFAVGRAAVVERVV